MINCERIIPELPSVTERYFEQRFKLDPRDGKHEDQCVLFHSNKLCVITIAPSHPILSESKQITSVDFQVDKKINRLDNKVSGKYKKGGQKQKEKSILCFATCSDGSRYCLMSGVFGTLIEVNKRLVNEPNLISTKPMSDGYVAIVLPPFNKSDSQKENLLSLEEYLMKIKIREEDG